MSKLEGLLHEVRLRLSGAGKETQIVLGLALASWQDLLDIAVLAAHGRGAANQLRSLYERSLALAFILGDFPALAHRFRNFAAIQEFKLVKEAQAYLSADVLDQLLASRGTSIDRVGDDRRAVREEFTVTHCEQCKTTRMATSWSKYDVKAQASKVGEPYLAAYLQAYLMSNLDVHATFASADRFANCPADIGPESEYLLSVGCALMLEALKRMSHHLQLGLEARVAQCESALLRSTQAAR